ncbi:MAG TPA: hypothetical protein VFK84_17875 [Burkholderiales bacterium]|nr:hypothetical protein [Burkholderiales bacterium]
MRRLLAAAAILAAGCVSVSEDAASPGDVGADAVVLVGKIEIRPPVRAEEQKYQAGWDVFNTKRHFIGRAILFTADTPQYRERTGNALNPPLEETFFLKLPRSHRYIVKGYVSMELVSRGASARSGFNQTELSFPVPIEVDVRPGDKAIYIGTLRLHRDEFHEVTKAELRDDYAEAMAEFRKRFAGEPLPRRAPLRRVVAKQ